MEFTELVEHLSDLIDLARSEGFNILATSMHASLLAARNYPMAFSIRDKSPTTPISARRCDDRSPDGLPCGGPPLHIGSHAALDPVGRLVMWDRDATVPAITFDVAQRIFWGR